MAQDCVHLQQKFKWTDKMWHTIDLFSFGLAFKSLDGSSQVKTSKMIAGWLNTGRQRKMMEPGANDSCPSCNQTNKTQSTFLGARIGLSKQSVVTR